MIKIYPFFGWTTKHTYKNVYNRLINCSKKDNGVWGNISLTDKKNEADYFVLFYNGDKIEKIDFSKTIVFETEPKFIISKNPLDKKCFLNYKGVNEMHLLLPNWYVSGKYIELENHPKKEKTLSAIISNKSTTNMHNQRKFFCGVLDTLDYFDCYGRKKINAVKNYKGELPTKNKGLMPYKYTFNCENSREKNYFTEKILDCLISETLCFYDGCPNINDFIDERCYIKIDVHNPIKSLNTIKQSIKNREWEKRIDIIRKEKCRIMDDLNPLNIIEKTILESSS